jgi:hypothetical protein
MKLEGDSDLCVKTVKKDDEPSKKTSIYQKKEDNLEQL